MFTGVVQQHGKFYRNLNTTDHKMLGENKSILQVQCPALLILSFKSNPIELNQTTVLGSVSSIFEHNQTWNRKKLCVRVWLSSSRRESVALCCDQSDSWQTQLPERGHSV